jgi:hypothetical protein
VTLLALPTHETRQPEREPVQIRGNAKDDDRWWALLLLIDETDLARADAFWRRHNGPMFAGLIANDGFNFDEQRQTYVRANGRDMDDSRAIVLAFIASAADELERDAQRMVSGQLTLDRWQEMQARAIKDLYIASASAGAGGLDHLTNEDLMDVQGKAGVYGLADAFTRLRRFGKQIEDGTVSTEPQIVNRAGLYALPANTAYEEARRASHVRAKDNDTGEPLFLYERSILGPNENHCIDFISKATGAATTGCVECADAGWQPIGTLPPIGLRTCGPRCKCSMEYAPEIPED